jgi:hypothetical protein
MQNLSMGNGKRMRIIFACCHTQKTQHLCYVLLMHSHTLMCWHTNLRQTPHTHPHTHTHTHTLSRTHAQTGTETYPDTLTRPCTRLCPRRALALVVARTPTHAHVHACPNPLAGVKEHLGPGFAGGACVELHDVDSGNLICQSCPIYGMGAAGDTFL